MEDMHSINFPGIPNKNRSCKPLWLTSASYELPSCAILSPSLSDRIAVVLYYAQVMDQKKVLSDFYKLCKYNCENKSQSSSLERSINAWIKISIVKLRRRREVIISETVSTRHTRFIFEVSQVVFGLFCDYLVDSGKNGQNARPKRQCITNWDVLFPKNEMFLPIASLNSAPLLCLKENDKMHISMSSNPLQCLRNLWLEFCYHPDPTQYIKSIHLQEEPKTTNSSISNLQNCSMDNINSTQDSTKVQKLATSSSIILQDNEDNIIHHSSGDPEIASSSNILQNDCSVDKINSKQYSSENSEATNSSQHSSDNPEATNSRQHSTDDLETTNSSTIFQNNLILDNINLTQHSTDNPETETNSSYLVTDNTNSAQHSTDNPETNSSYLVAGNTSSAQHSDDSQSSLSSESYSDSSGSWSCNDFDDDSTGDDDHLRSYTSNNKFLEKCNATIEWLQSTACGFDSDDDTVNFGEALTEENCLGSPSSRGSLNFVDCSDEEDEYEVIFFEGSPDTGFENDAFMDMSQGFENPCFEDSFRAFREPSFIEIVNECWNDDMMELQNKPRKPSKVSFAPEPSLVTVQYFVKTDENTFDASLILDNLRFRQRIADLGHLLSPFLTIEHRMMVRKRNCSHED